MSAMKQPGERSPRQFLDESGVYQVVYGPMMKMAHALMRSFPDLDSGRAERLVGGLMAALCRLGDASKAERVSVEVMQALVAGRMSGDQFRSLREAAPLLIDEMFVEAGGDPDAFVRHGCAGTYPSDLIFLALDALARDRW
jgi:tape measure domain-containing protein